MKAGQVLGLVLVMLTVAIAAYAAACTPAERAEVRAADNFLCADVRPLVNGALASGASEATDGGTVDASGEVVELAFVVRATRRKRAARRFVAVFDDAGADAGDGGP